jgi:hypothetical protein
MNRRRMASLVMNGLLAFTTLAVISPLIHAGCDGCASSMSQARTKRRLGCDTCPYRAGPTPNLINPDTFGFTPTVWSLWPGPLDPNTSYPNAPAPATKPSTPPPEPPPPQSQRQPEQPTSPYAAIPKR